jgi:hypothetical protein
MGDQAFDDADDLHPAGGEVAPAELAATLAALIRADLGGVDPGAVERAFGAAGDAERRSLALAWGDALAVDALGDWIAADADRRAGAEGLALALAPPDPGMDEGAAALAALRAFGDWGRFPHPVLVVPGYTPANLGVAAPGVHEVARRRLEVAARDFAARVAPFVLVSGGAVYPRGTPYAEGMEMKRALLAMGVPEDRILVEARARHSTTNLRNAGRVLLAEGLPRAMIVTLGGGAFGSDFFGQDFYFAHPTLSTFHGRCERELGYRVGELTGAGEGHILFVAAAEVRRVGWRDALDP